MTFGFENCYVVQFTIDQHNNLVPLRNTEMVLCYSDRYDVSAYFWGARSSKCGVYRDPKATHWAIVDFSDPENPEMVVYEAFDFESKIRHVHKVRNHYVVIRNFNKYFKIRASEYSSVKELKQSATSDE